MESSPTVLRPKIRRTVITISISSQITVGIIIVQTCKERSHGRTSEAGINGRGTCTQSWIMNNIRRQVRICHRSIIIIRFPTLLSQHSCKRMFINLSVIGHIIFQLPESTVVFLDRAVITITFPVPQVYFWLIPFSFIITDIVTKFCMPGQVLH